MKESIKLTKIPHQNACHAVIEKEQLWSHSENNVISQWVLRSFQKDFRYITQSSKHELSEGMGKGKKGTLSKGGGGFS